MIKQTLVNTQWDGNFLATASYSLSQPVKGTFSFGQNLNSRSFRQQGQVGNGLIANQPFNLSNASTFPPPKDLETKIRTAGFFAQSTFDLWDQLFLKGGVRYDGASSFSGNDQWAWFPSASAAWQFTKMTGNFGGLLSYGKARIAYGQVGTQPSPYLGATIFTSSLFNDFDAFGASSSRTASAGSSLRTSSRRPASSPSAPRSSRPAWTSASSTTWPTSSFTWYKRNSTDVILLVPVAASSGFTVEGANAARIRNAGTEWSLNVRPITHKNFGWDFGLTLGTNRNRVEDLLGAEFVNYGGLGGVIQGGPQAVAEVGQQIGTLPRLRLCPLRAGRRS